MAKKILNLLLSLSICSQSIGIQIALSEQNQQLLSSLKPTKKAGFLDTTFGGNSTGYVTKHIGTGNDDGLYAIIAQSDGKLVIGGYSYTDGSNKIFALARYNKDGILDTSFGPNGNGYVTTTLSAGTSEKIHVLLEQSDGKIVAGGYAKDGSSSYDLALARYTQDGILDTTFGGNDTGYVTTHVGAGSNDRIYTMIQQSDGKIVISGKSHYDGANYKTVLARYSKDGVLDTSFGGSNTGYVLTAIGAYGGSDFWALAEQSDGKLVAAGGSYFTNGSTYDFMLARFSKDGVLDTSFGGSNTGYVVTRVGSGHQDEIYSMIQQADGKLVVGGYMLYDGTNWDFALARYTKDGILDTSFGGSDTGFTRIHLGAGDDDEVNKILQQVDGKILVAGITEGSTSGDFRFAMLRYSANGILDTSFGNSGYMVNDIGPGTDDRIQSMLIQSDGKIVVVGWSGMGSSVYNFSLARYTIDTDPLKQTALLFSNGGGGALA